MKKNHSKSTISKKNKTIAALPESKNNSRVHRANSSLKIHSQNTDQATSHIQLQPTLSKSNLHNLSHKFSAQISNPKTSYLQLVDKQQSQRTSSHNHYPKSSIQTIPARQTRDEILKLRLKNQELIKQNTTLLKKCNDLQQLGLKDKQKIKNLIIRINEIKNHKEITSQAKPLHPSTSKLPINMDTGTISHSFLLNKQKLQTPSKNFSQGHCQRQDCVQRKKYLQKELYRQRLQCNSLQLQRREWQKNREGLKQQYNQLLDQIKRMRQDEY